MNANLSLEGSHSWEHYYIHYEFDEPTVVSIYDCIGEVPNYFIHKGEDKITELIEDIITYIKNEDYVIVNWDINTPDKDSSKQTIREYLTDIFLR